MTALRLDYQQEPPSRHAGPVLLALALLAALFTGAYYFELNEQVALWEGGLEQIERSHGWQPASGREDAHEAEEFALEVKRANEVLRQLTLPWDELFQAVESTAGAKIALLALEPDTEKRTVRISGEARDFASMFKFIALLEERDVFGPVYLQSHQVQEQEPERPVRFSLLAAWGSRP